MERAVVRGLWVSIALALSAVVTGCSDGKDNGASEAPSKALSAQDLQMASLTRTDVPNGFQLKGEGDAIERTSKSAQADDPACQPIADLFSAAPKMTREARTGQEMYDFRGGREDWYHVYLDAYGSGDSAHQAIEAVRNSVDSCSNFSDGTESKRSVAKALAPKAGEETVAFTRDRAMVNVVRVGSVLAVFKGSDTSEHSRAGVVSPALLEAQIAKLTQAIEQAA